MKTARPPRKEYGRRGYSYRFLQLYWPWVPVKKLGLYTNICKINNKNREGIIKNSEQRAELCDSIITFFFMNTNAGIIKIPVEMYYMIAVRGEIEVKIGIPRALAYYAYYPFLTAF